ncbi:MAG TPA: hypothetical protein VHR42_10175 [Clostridia bacterium]|nr:hypothetical protein [Clostridia bacterium]
MENDRLKEIRAGLSALPVMEQCMNNLRRQLSDAQSEYERLKRKFEAESQDVDKLYKESFTVMLLRKIGRYEGKLNKETQEQLAAKMEFDKAGDRVERLRSEEADAESRVEQLKNDRRQFEEELKRRRDEMKNNMALENHERFHKMEKQLQELSKQSAETDQAISAAEKVLSTAQSALDSLQSAESWATYDVWSNGGILSHSAKYEAVDDAEIAMESVNEQLENLHKELSDINLQDSIQFTPIDSTTRTIDFWFDNIFTDLNVRSRIQDNMDTLEVLCKNLNDLMDSLKSSKSKIETKETELEQDEENLLVG